MYATAAALEYSEEEEAIGSVCVCTHAVDQKEEKKKKKKQKRFFSTQMGEIDFSSVVVDVAILDG